MKTLKTLIILLIISGCTSSKNEDNIKDSTIKFVESAGKIELKMDRHGNWIEIKSSGSASLLLDDENALEQAMNVATLRAKANLIEFLETDVRSYKTTDTIIAAGVNKEIASNVSEKITSESKGILKGVNVVERKVSENKNYVFVTISSDKKVLKIAKGLKNELK